ncbi:MAG: hypothetical protein NWQ15_05440, partial [Flavobacterium sp.]|nr:hypothetical protein [Flavobacterium sp.]
MFEDFESGNLPQDWSVSGLWHISNSCVTGNNLTKSAYYGVDNTCSFDNGLDNSGNLTSNTISIPSDNVASAKLSFRYAYQGEGGSPPSGYDNASFKISVNGGQFIQVASLSDTNSDGNWLSSVIDITPYIGNPIVIQWNFNSTDASGNDGLGLQIDDVTITTYDAIPNIICEGNSTILTAHFQESNISGVNAYSVNSNSNVAFIDIRQTGSSLTGIEDESSHVVSMPDFIFNNITYDKVTIFNNGFLVFGDVPFNDENWDNGELPNDFFGIANPASICAYWDDLIPDGSNTSINTHIVNNKYIVQWTDEKPFFDDPVDIENSGSITFQIQLDLISGEIHIVYQDVIFDNPDFDNGKSATIGLNFDVTNALQFSFDNESVIDNQSITYTPITMSYLWSTGETTQTIIVSTPGDYTVTLTNSIGCSTTSDPISILSILYNASINIFGSTVLCDGESVNLIAALQTDSFYTVNSNSNVAFIDISSTGTLLNIIGDGDKISIAIPNFTYNNVSYTEATIYNKGVLIFGNELGDMGYGNGSLPSSFLDTNSLAAICAMWDDLIPAPNGSVNTQIIDNNKFIVQWTNEAHWDYQSDGTVTFQIQLDLVSGEIHMVYQDVIFGNSEIDNGLSATIGLMFDANNALEYASNSISLIDNQSITYTPSLQNSYLWSTGETTQLISVTEPGDYSVAVTNNNGCTATSDSISITSNIPTITTSNSTDLCNGASTVLTATSENSFIYNVISNSNIPFIDISQIGTSLANIDDESSTVVSIPNFMYNNSHYTKATIFNNGFLVFGDVPFNDENWDNGELPNDFFGIANPASICAYWDDLIPDGSNTSINTHIVNNKYIVQWTDEKPFFDDPVDIENSGSITFQIQLDLISGEIHLVYQDVIFD